MPPPLDGLCDDRFTPLRLLGAAQPGGQVPAPKPAEPKVEEKAPEPTPAPQPVAAAAESKVETLRVETVPEASNAAARLLEIATRNADELVEDAKNQADRIV